MNGLDRRDWLTAVVIALVVFPLRVAFLLHSPDTAWPHSMLYEGDAPVWATWANHLMRGEPFEADLAFRTPGVAFPLQWFGWVEPPFTSAKLLWCAISAATPAALYLVLARWHSRRSGIIASVLLALSFGSFAIATSLNNEVPYALLLVLISGATLAWADRPAWHWSIPLGALHATSLLLRAEHLLLVALLLGYMIVAGRSAGVRRVLVQVTVTTTTIALLCLPWTLRTHDAARRFNNEAPTIPYDSMWPEWKPSAITAFEGLPGFARAPNFSALCAFSLRNRWKEVTDAEVRAYFGNEWKSTPECLPEWSIISMKGPLDFALANHFDADGGFSRVGLGDAFDPNPDFSFARPSHNALVIHGYGIGLDSIRSDPKHWLGLVREKLLRFNDGLVVGLFAHNWPHAVELDRKPIDVATHVRGDAPWWTALMLLSIASGAGIACVRRADVVWVLMLAYRVAVVIGFYGYARQAIAIAPVTLALSAIAIDAACVKFVHIADRPRLHAIARWSTFFATFALLALAAKSAWSPPRLLARPFADDAKINSTPHWGEGAFESTDRLLLVPHAQD